MPEEPEPGLIRRHRGRKLGDKILKPEDKPEGLSEKELRSEWKKDQVWSCKYKKRYREDLSTQEIDAIITATKEPYRLQKDVA